MQGTPTVRLQVEWQEWSIYNLSTIFYNNLQTNGALQKGFEEPLSEDVVS